MHVINNYIVELLILHYILLCERIAWKIDVLIFIKLYLSLNI